MKIKHTVGYGLTAIALSVLSVVLAVLGQETLGVTLWVISLVMIFHTVGMLVTRWRGGSS